MLDQPVAAHIEIVESPEHWTISAFVAGASERPLTWRLESISRSSGGSSTVSQSGSVRQSAEAPVAVLGINAGSQGEVILRVYDGDREVASDKVDLSALGARSGSNESLSR